VSLVQPEFLIVVMVSLKLGGAVVPTIVILFALTWPCQALSRVLDPQEADAINIGLAVHAKADVVGHASPQFLDSDSIADKEALGVAEGVEHKRGNAGTLSSQEPAPSSTCPWL